MNSIQFGEKKIEPVELFWFYEIISAWGYDPELAPSIPSVIGRFSAVDLERLKLSDEKVVYTTPCYESSKLNRSFSIVFAYRHKGKIFWTFKENELLENLWNDQLAKANMVSQTKRGLLAVASLPFTIGGVLLIGAIVGPRKVIKDVWKRAQYERFSFPSHTDMQNFVARNP
jgi:hypothetical protein